MACQYYPGNINDLVPPHIFSVGSSSSQDNGPYFTPIPPFLNAGLNPSQILTGPAPPFNNAGHYPAQPVLTPHNALVPTVSRHPNERPRPSRAVAQATNMQRQPSNTAAGPQTQPATTIDSLTRQPRAQAHNIPLANGQRIRMVTTDDYDKLYNRLATVDQMARGEVSKYEKEIKHLNASRQAQIDQTVAEQIDEISTKFIADWGAGVKDLKDRVAELEAEVATRDAQIDLTVAEKTDEVSARYAADLTRLNDRVAELEADVARRDAADKRRLAQVHEEGRLKAAQQLAASKGGRRAGAPQGATPEKRKEHDQSVALDIATGFTSAHYSWYDKDVTRELRDGGCRSPLAEIDGNAASAGDANAMATKGAKKQGTKRKTASEEGSQPRKKNKSAKAHAKELAAENLVSAALEATRETANAVTEHDEPETNDDHVTENERNAEAEALSLSSFRLQPTDNSSTNTATSVDEMEVDDEDEEVEETSQQGPSEMSIDFGEKTEKQKAKEEAHRETLAKLAVTDRPISLNESLRLGELQRANPSLVEPPPRAKSTKLRLKNKSRKRAKGKSMDLDDILWNNIRREQEERKALQTASEAKVRANAVASPFSQENRSEKRGSQEDVKPPTPTRAPLTREEKVALRDQIEAAGKRLRKATFALDWSQGESFARQERCEAAFQKVRAELEGLQEEQEMDREWARLAKWEEAQRDMELFGDEEDDEVDEEAAAAAEAEQLAAEKAMEAQLDALQEAEDEESARQEMEMCGGVAEKVRQDELRFRKCMARARGEEESDSEEEEEE